MTSEALRLGCLRPWKCYTPPLRFCNAASSTISKVVTLELVPFEQVTRTIFDMRPFNLPFSVVSIRYYLLFLPPWNGFTTWFSAFHESIRGLKVRLLHFENGERRESLSHLSLCDRQKEGTSPSIWNASIMMSICEQKEYPFRYYVNALRITFRCVQLSFL